MGAAALWVSITAHDMVPHWLWDRLKVVPEMVMAGEHRQAAGPACALASIGDITVDSSNVPPSAAPNTASSAKAHERILSCIFTDVPFGW